MARQPEPEGTDVRAALRRRAGRPKYKPTEAERTYVKRMAQLGIPFNDIAKVLRIDPKTLRTHFAEDVEDGRVEAHIAVANVLFRKATNPNITGATVRAAELWLRCRAGWVEAQPERGPETPEGAIDNTIMVRGGLPDLDYEEVDEAVTRGAAEQP